MNRFIALLFVVITINSCQNITTAQQTIRYVALGDSYTFGLGAKKGEDWPSLLTKHLKENTIPVELTANLAVSGRTTYGVIDAELPVLDELKPSFVTLLIGVNDWIVGVDTAAFRENLVLIIDHIQTLLPNKSKLVVITLPDFSTVPSAYKYSKGRDVTKGISAFNSIIISEAKKHGLKTADLFESSKKVKENPDWIAEDGFHPSAKGYTVWETLIYPVAYSLLMK